MSWIFNFRKGCSRHPCSKLINLPSHFFMVILRFQFFNEIIFFNYCFIPLLLRCPNCSIRVHRNGSLLLTPCVLLLVGCHCASLSFSQNSTHHSRKSFILRYANFFEKPRKNHQIIQQPLAIQHHSRCNQAHHHSISRF